MFKTTKRILLVTAMTLSVAAPSAVASDFRFTKFVDKSSPTIYQNAGAGSTTQPAQPAPPAK
jgi:type VI protein secretion system component Hcp